MHFLHTLDLVLSTGASHHRQALLDQRSRLLHVGPHSPGWNLDPQPVHYASVMNDLCLNNADTTARHFTGCLSILLPTYHMA